MGTTRRTLATGLVAVLALATGCSGTGEDSASTAGDAAIGGVEVAADQAQVDAPAARKRIRTADVGLAVEEAEQVGGAADAIVTITGEVGGVVDEDQRSYGEDATADLVVRVPPDDLEATIARFGEVATITSSSISTDDVTEQYTDLETRIANLEASTERVRALVGEATDVVQVAALENELRTRELELEQAKGQLRVLDDQIELARVSVTIRTEAQEAAESAPAPSQALANGWSAFVTAATWGLALVLTLLPFLVVLAVAIVAWRAVRRRRPPKARTQRMPQGWTAVPPSGWQPTPPAAPQPGSPGAPTEPTAAADPPATEPVGPEPSGPGPSGPEPTGSRADT